MSASFLARVGSLTGVFALGAVAFVANAAPSSAATATSSSNDLAGYLKSSPPASASAAVRFRVPTITCSGSAPISELLDGAAVVGLTLVTPKTTAGEVIEKCQGTSASYSAVVDVAGTGRSASFTPAPGDVISVAASMSASASSVTIKDVTTKKSDHATGGGTTNTDVFDGLTVGFNSSNNPYPIPTFSSVSFSGAKIDGATVAASGATAYNLVNSSNMLQIKTGALGTLGNAWKATFEHN